MHEEIEFSQADRVETLTAGQIDLLARTQNDIFICCMRERPGYFDIERIRLLMEMGIIEAKRRAAALTPTAQTAPSVPDENAAFEAWFRSEQGTPYDGMWSFAKAAWMARARLAPGAQEAV